MEWLTLQQWSPYAAGVGIGILSCLALLLSDKPIGCSTAFAQTSGMIERLFRGRKVLEKPYFVKVPPVIDWYWMLVAGVFVGAFLSARLSSDFGFQWVPTKWACAFGDGRALRIAVAALGGIFLGFGARWAGGCTSGHGISGSLQLALSGWVFFASLFASGLVTAFAIFGRDPARG
jgi:uncharacterized membrane protein YedE/YeeE